MRRPALLLAVALAVASPAVAQTSSSEGRAFTPQDWYKLTTVSSPAMSPDGKYVAFTVTTVNESANKRHSEVWLVPAAGGEATRMTSPGTESSNPRWSHDGSLLLFTSRRQGGQGSTWALRMDRTPSGEAFQPEALKEGSMPADASFTVFTEGGSGGFGFFGGGDDDSSGGEARKDDPYARMKPLARPPYESVTHPEDARRFDGMHFVDLPMMRNGRGYIANRRDARDWTASQIYRQNAGDTAKTQLTEGAYSHRNAVVSPDGKWIAFVADPDLRPDSVVTTERDSIAELPYDATRDEAPRNDADIFVIPVKGGEPRRVTHQNGSEGRLVWSPDSRRIAFVSSLARTSNNRVWVVEASAKDGTPKNVVGDWQYEPSGIDWMPDGKIAMSASIGGRTALFHVDPATATMTEVVSGRRRINGFSYDDAFDKVAFVATSVDKPTEVYIAGIDGKGERKLTGFNDALNKEIAWPKADRFTYASVGGLEIEAWLQYPYGYEPGKKYPLVLYIHGGPHSAYGEGWFDEFHNITGAGMFVLYTNPRGSGGYGADFTYSTRGRWGMEDYEDLMKAVDIAIARPDVDAQNIGVTGGSYGGFMTAWITTKTNRFKAAQVDRMISDWFSWYGSSDAQGLTEFEFYGKPWDNPELYRELSPASYLENVRTPTLLVQSEEDYRATMTSAEEWFVGLRKQGVPAEFVRYPRSNHDLSRTGEPWLLVDRLGRLRQWFTHYLMADNATAEHQP